MDEAKAQLSERLKNANNVLVSVSRDPSVDQLAALLGLSIFLNKQGKHAAAVFSGQIPGTIEFLKPETTIQKNTDSLRDFIIALDKSKADKLRYKVEDNIVRIFITPYRSSIGQDDLEFSQGDFNVDVVIALGVSEQSELDEAITAHGRILHDAFVGSINTEAHGNLGAVNWVDPSASCLSELVTELIQTINKDDLDEQIATALLTGIVATTDRFRNEKTSAKTMSVSSLLMSAGANQQLVATQLEQPILTGNEPGGETEESSSKDNEAGTLEIEHTSDDVPAQEPNMELPAPEEEAPRLQLAPDKQPEDNTPPAGLSGGPKLVTEPPILGGTLTANSRENDLEPTTDPMSMPASEEPKLLDRKPDVLSQVPVPSAPVNPGVPQLLTPPPAGWSPVGPTTDEPVGPNQVHIDEHGTLSQLEESVHSPHIEGTANADAAREEINRALSSASNNDIPPPIEALNASPLGPELHAPTSDPNSPPPVPPPLPPFNPGL